MVTSRDGVKLGGSRKRIPAERVEDVEALLRRTLLLLGRLALAKKTKVYPYQIGAWEQELAYALEDINDMQVVDIEEAPDGS